MGLLQNQQLIASLAAALFLGAAWHFPETYLSAFLTCLFALLLVWLVRRPRAYSQLYLVGVISNCIGFHWLYYTISHFGALPMWAAALLFALFIAVSSLQFVLFVFLFRIAPKWLDRYFLALPLSWVTAELFSIRIFPWHLGHTLHSFSWFIQLAEIGGTLLLSFLVLVIAQLVLSALKRPLLWGAVISLILLISLYGSYRIHLLQEIFQSRSDQSITALMVQGNISLNQKHSSKLFQKNVEIHRKLSHSHQADLIIWPESVFMEFVYDKLQSVNEDPRISGLPLPAPLLFGGLTFESETAYYNSSLVVMPDGSFLPSYHKQILMPFGEFTPLGSFFPILKDINHTAADFTAGSKPGIFQIPTSKAGIVHVSPLICYEDVVQSLSVDASRAGAELLVNQTNDGWFGRSIASHQHHLIALYRAIENRRFFLRATNSGYSAIVSPTGKTVASLPTYESTTLSGSVIPLEKLSVFAQLHGNKSWIGLIVAFLLLSCVTKQRVKDF